MSHGERIKNIRKILKLNQKDFSDKIGINQSTLSQYESGTINPSKAVLISISNSFGVSIEWLLTGEGEMLAAFAGKNYQNIGDGNSITVIDDVYKSKININDRFNSLSPEAQEVINLLMEFPIPSIISELKEKLMKYKNIT
ncbi:helix-turn-helix domain-containing protein [Geovibrio ferrireducens]|uniref:helix-turn-helix domain-containing protein n=1 Tax=Geovibrio ferrireducens TaxID=46201 RepID=UPI0022463A34|nr:helix-turn-helix transcriptional regulator [Geovibrio ferrireducens]